MIKTLEEFKIGEFTFRYKKIKPTLLLTLLTQLSKDSFETTEETYDFILENTEIKMNENWLTIKNGDIYYPPQFEENIVLLQKIVMKFISEFLTPVFTKSAE